MAGVGRVVGGRVWRGGGCFGRVASGGLGRGRAMGRGVEGANRRVCAWRLSECGWACGVSGVSGERGGRAVWRSRAVSGVWEVHRIYLSRS